MLVGSRDGAVKKSKRRGRNAVTMHEVAEHAGVSPMTVSRVISGDANVKPETRKRVEAAIKHFGYSPNVAARNLARAASVHIGLMYNNPSAAYMNELLVGVLEHSRKAGCQILLEKCGTPRRAYRGREALADGVGGIILTPPLSDSRAHRCAAVPGYSLRGRGCRAASRAAAWRCGSMTSKPPRP